MRPNLISGIIMIVLAGALAMPAVAGSLSSDVENAFRSGNPGALAGRLPDEGKVFLSIPAAGVRSGSYSKQQVLTTLRQMFRSNKTKSVNVSGGPNSAVRAQWTFKGTGKERTITIYFAVNTGKIASIRGEK